MKSFRKIFINCIWLSIALALWFLYLYRNTSSTVSCAADLKPYLSIGSGFNYVALHCSIYLGVYLIIAINMQPLINEQVFVRISREKILERKLFSIVKSSILFTTVFSVTYFLMLIYKIGFSVLLEYNFAVAWLLNYFKLCHIYMIFGLIFLLCSFIFKKRESALLTTIFIAVAGNFFGKYFDIMSVRHGLAVYDFFYSESGLDMLDYIGDFFRNCAIVIALYYVSSRIFERKDILDGKK